VRGLVFDGYEFTCLIYVIIIGLIVSITALFPSVGVNYPNWLMGPFYLGNGSFFY